MPTSHHLFATMKPLQKSGRGELDLEWSRTGDGAAVAVITIAALLKGEPITEITCGHRFATREKTIVICPYYRR